MVEYRDNQLRGRDKNEQEIINALREEGLAVYAVNPLPGSRGHPDLIVCCEGRAYPVEVKEGIHDQSKLSAIQCYFGVVCYFVVLGNVSGVPHLVDQIKRHARGEQSEWLDKPGYIGFLYDNQIRNETVKSELRKRSAALCERQTAIDIGINLNSSHDPLLYLKEYCEKCRDKVKEAKLAIQYGNFEKAGYAYRDAQNSARRIAKYIKYSDQERSKKWKVAVDEYGARADKCWEKFHARRR